MFNLFDLFSKRKVDLDPNPPQQNNIDFDTDDMLDNYDVDDGCSIFDDDFDMDL